ncbi:PEGA domain-containing protein [Polyangium sp. 15x6]|uniref:PEGA domain-containing protein n=1 Tax=Polyangium sp. 15x6 TaxID=3042687 RepID=UPI00249CACD0|nr:PEGA domain-containing protein [Polyangium sp. 15x6]MDI3282537.1 PEGA domain-containing protein [Polyangium sp. 15x6]
MKRIVYGLFAVMLAFAFAAPARAGDAVEEARILFTAGAQAYEAGRYADAVDAFRAAHALTPQRPTVLFSLAQAERRHFTVARDPAVLQAAITHFRGYLELVPEGGRRADVVAALGELESIAASLEQKNIEASASKARLLITTQTPGAVITIDGTERTTVPVIEAIAPGKHAVVVSAPGFVGETREIVAVEGAILPVEINLRERPSFLAVTAPRGASIQVDGRSQGEAPLVSPIELPSGAHVVTVAQRGHEPRTLRVMIERGGTNRLDVSLATTRQRRVSYGLVAGAGVAFVSGFALAVSAALQEDAAERLLSRTEQGHIDLGTLEAYESARTSRDVLRTGAIGSFAMSTVFGVAAIATYWFDNPTPPPAGSGETARVERFARVVPMPGGAWIGVGGRF